MSELFFNSMSFSGVYVCVLLHFLKLSLKQLARLLTELQCEIASRSIILVIQVSVQTFERRTSHYVNYICKNGGQF